MEAPLSGDWQRLHPFTLAHRALRSLPQLLVLFLPIALSTSGRATAIASLVLTIGFGVFLVPLLVAQYTRFRYRVTSREIVLRSGVFSQQTRNIPIERIQRVEILQPLLARAFGTARVLLMTAGGAGAEGTLEYVSLQEAHHLRETIRQFQRGAAPGAAAPAEAPAAAPGAAALAAPTAVLFRLTPALLARQGMMRFSLVYIALAFSALQWLDIQPDDIVDFFLQQRYAAYADYLPQSPAATALLTLVIALALSWLAGIATTVNSYHGYTLAREGVDKLHTVRGLLGRFERTIPLRKVQALVFRQNPIMRRWRYTRLSAQTMGLDEQARGAAPVVPFAPEPAALTLAAEVFGYRPPAGLTPVSPLHFRRTALRMLFALAVAAGGPAFWWPEALWGLLLAPLLVWLAWAQYRAHRYHFDGTALVVQRGALWRTVWAVPVSRTQAFSVDATVFQRRLGLVTLSVDTAGASELGGPSIYDLPAANAEALLDALRDAFRQQPRGLARPFAVADQSEVEHDGSGFAERGALKVEHGPPQRERPGGGPDEAQPPREAGSEHGEEPLR